MENLRQSRLTDAVVVVDDVNEVSGPIAIPLFQSWPGDGNNNINL